MLVSGAVKAASVKKIKSRCKMGNTGSRRPA